MTLHDIATESLLQRAGTGDAVAVGELFTQYRERLRRMVRLRMDRRLQGRLDESDVIQESYMEFVRSVSSYVSDPNVPIFLWLRTIVGRKLMALHRQHLGTEMRDAGREALPHRGAMPEASSVSLAEQLLGRFTSPTQAAMRAEQRAQVHDALAELDPIDREILSLRHFEQLSNAETASVLELSAAAASNRYVRALRRIKRKLSNLPELFGAVPGSKGGDHAN